MGIGLLTHEGGIICKFELYWSMGMGLGINIIIFRNKAIEMERIVHMDGAINGDESINP